MVQEEVPDRLCKTCGTCGRGKNCANKKGRARDERLDRQARLLAQADRSTQPSALTPFRLPVEVLTEILSNLFTLDVLSASRVCRSWNATTQSARVWRNINFMARKVRRKKASMMDHFYDYVDTVRDKCDNKIESVNFTHLFPEEFWIDRKSVV